MSATPTSTGHVSRPAKRSGSLRLSGSGGKRLRVVTCGHIDPKMDGELPPIPRKQETPTGESTKRKQGSSERELTKQQDHNAERKRKSMRRSSFVRGRISMSMPVTQSTDLSSDIPQDLPEDERLKKLCMSVFEQTLEKLNDEFGGLDGLQQLEVQARDAVDRRLHDMKADGTLASITVTDTRTPNPVNEDLENIIKTYNVYIKKLKTESENWDAVVEMRRRKADEAEREEVAAADDIITEPVAPLSAQQEQFLREKPDYKGLLEELKSFREQALLAANELAEKTKVMDHVMEVANEVLKEQAQLLHTHSFESIKNFDSPRSLLGNPSE